MKVANSYGELGMDGIPRFGWFQDLTQEYTTILIRTRAQGARQQGVRLVYRQGSLP